MNTPRCATRFPLALTILSSLRLFRFLLAIQDCSLYIAPSSRSTEDAFLLGVFAGIDYQQGNAIGPSDLAIPIIDVEFHNAHKMIPADPNEEMNPNKTLPRNFFDSIARVLWTSHNTGAGMEIDENSYAEGHRVVVSIPGIALLARDSPSIINADFNQAWILNRTMADSDEIFEQAEVSHPGRGAYTHYAPIVIEATRYIPAGSEIFISYGVKYENQINYTEVDKTLEKINTFFYKYQDQVTPSQRQALYSFFVDDIIPYSGSKTSDIQTDSVQAFPNNFDELTSILQKGGSLIHHNPETMKSLTWLDTHGQCIDGLYAGISSIPHAGRGAFAKRAIRRGDVIAPMPLLKINDKSWLDMYEKDLTYNDDEEIISKIVDSDDPILTHKQLLLNYCFGHPKSSILLHPVGSVVNMVNHKQNGKGANAEILWSHHPIYNRDWLNKSMDELQELDGYGIGFDLVATRDIKADEEVFLDYGTEWDMAWKNHLESWLDDIWPLKASDFNQQLKRSTFFTNNEREELILSSDSDPYPENIETVCQVAWIEENRPDGSPILIFDSNVEYRQLWTTDNMYRCGIIHRDVIDGGDWYKVNDYFYTVIIYPTGDTIEKVPHNNIRFQDKAYTGDMHNPNAFRKPIGIPDTIFPDAWRNL